LNVGLALPPWFTQRPIQPMGLLRLASVRHLGQSVKAAVRLFTS